MSDSPFQLGRLRAIRGLQKFLVLLLALSFAYGAFAWGTVPIDKGIVLVFHAILTFIFCLWVLWILLRFEQPKVPWLVWIPFGWILLQGWLMVANARATYDRRSSAFGFPEETLGQDWLFGSVAQHLSLETMINVTVLLAGFLVLIDLCAKSRTARRQLMMSVAVVGFAVAVTGILQKATGSPYRLFDPEAYQDTNFFSAYRYHGNAASLLNMAWPIAFMLWLRASVKGLPAQRGIWAGVALFTFVGTLVNTSKIGHVLALGIAVALVFVYSRTILSLVGRRINAASLIVGVVLFLLVVGTMIFLSYEQSLVRWQNLEGSLTYRVRTWEITWNALPKSGFFGFGPGSFQAIFPFFAADQGVTLQFFWRFTHQDYLQYLVEWGYVGFAFWAFLIGGAWLRGWLKMKKEFYNPGTLVILSGFLVHAAVDFPAQIASLQWVVLLIVAILWIGSGNRAKNSR